MTTLREVGKAILSENPEWSHAQTWNEVLRRLGEAEVLEPCPDCHGQPRVTAIVTREGVEAAVRVFGREAPKRNFSEDCGGFALNRRKTLAILSALGPIEVAEEVVEASNLREVIVSAGAVDTIDRTIQLHPGDRIAILRRKEAPHD